MPASSDPRPDLGLENGMGPPPKKKAKTSVTTLDSTEKTQQSAKSSAYDNNFVALIAAHNINLPTRRGPKPKNFAEMKAKMEAPRLSLSAARFSEAEYDSWLDAVENSHREADVIANVFPTIKGHTYYPCSFDTLCSNWAPFDSNLVTPKPDFWDGARQTPNNLKIRQEFGRLIMPLTSYEDPFIPNFFAELKSPKGSINIAQRQACYDGALSARGMFCILTGGMTGPYDGCAYTISATYSGGTLEMFLHHVSPPETDNDLPHYHMTPMGAWALHNSIDTFRQGVSAFQNGRDIADGLRGQVLRAANARMQISRQNLSLGSMYDVRAEHGDTEGDNDDEFEAQTPSSHDAA